VSRIKTIPENARLIQQFVFNVVNRDCEIRNMKKNLLRLQVQTVFKDENDFSIEMDTNWELVLIPEFSTYAYTTTALNNKAKKYTIRIKLAQ